MTTRAELDPKIADVRSALPPLLAAIKSISNATIYATKLGAYSAQLHAIDSWATTQAAEVVAGTRPLARWTSYGNELKKNLTDLLGDIGFVDRNSQAAMDVGDLSEAALKPLDEQIGALRTDLNELELQAAAWEKDRVAFTPVRNRLSPALQELYWGGPAQSAVKNLGRLRYLVEGLESGLRSLHGGQNINFEDLAKPALGNPFVGVAGALAVIAIASALGAVLWAFFRHADELSHAEGEKAYLELAKSNPDAALKLQAGRNEAERLRNPPPTFSTAVVVVAVVVTVTVATAIALHIRSKARRTNPRRRSNPKPVQASARKPKRLRAAA